MGGKDPTDENFSYVSAVLKYIFFFFNMIFWVISMVLISVGAYARVAKHAEAVTAYMTVDPAVLLITVGALMFFITFCGCVGSLRENICLLQTFCVCLLVIFLLQLATAVLGFVFSSKARVRVNKTINKAITHYRDDLDLQNLIDYGQKEFSCCGANSYKDWSQNMYFNCSDETPSRERCSVPFSCCLQPADRTVINTMCGHDMQKKDEPEAGGIINTDGCIDKLVNWFHSNMFLVGGIALGLAIPQLVGMFLAQILINQIKDQIELQKFNARHM